ncbi:MAG: DNA modification methylase [Mariniblastus sp.]|jgi:DNA modification methylase/predicted GIY-YIG superfamily endonuclease
MAKKLSKFIGKIHQGDCIKGLKKVPDGSVDLAFADPPFNIGFKYDEYKDRLEDDQYLAWSHDWISQVHRVLKDNGTFWLAIGDEYAAELKLEAQKIGFHCRSWVIWYYTFGVNCKKKFTRSHAHIFHFVKDKNDFVFNHDDMDIRVPSARQLVYNDSRANPNGRMPDDTWILRPQDLVNGFEPDEDTWYFPRVAGTFKEREGFHGCQMPEQLIGRIVRSCSSPGDIVIDPFSGSSTTIAVAKKLARRYFSFELSKDYVRLGQKRLDGISVGDKLDGAAEPRVSAPKTDRKKASAKSKTPLDLGQRAQLELFPDEPEIHAELADSIQGMLEAFSSANHGYSVDRIVADPILNEDFQRACDRHSIPGTPAERNRFLFRIRKAGKFKSFDINTTVRTEIGWKEISPFVDASEIAWRQISNKYCLSLDELFCDPRIATQFDELAAGFAPGFQPLDYRWAALKLRKEGSNARQRATLRTPKQLGISALGKTKLKNLAGTPISELDFDSIPTSPGVYLVREPDGSPLYAGETSDLAFRLHRSFHPAGHRSKWIQRDENLEVFFLPVESVTDYRLARQSVLLKWHRPAWNTLKELST